MVLWPAYSFSVSLAEPSPYVAIFAQVSAPLQQNGRRPVIYGIAGALGAGRRGNDFFFCRQQFLHDLLRDLVHLYFLASSVSDTNCTQRA